MSQQLQQIIDTAWENRAELSPKAAPADVREAVAHAIEQLDKGALQVIEFGPPNGSIHKIDEHIEVRFVDPLKNVYRRVLEQLIA
ncbi:hypothetical protein [Burkholderia sola]|uniref:hypothetical protein n=1 Tax=Burkholderia sola TaxID=2843302 RepID=UPI0023DD7EDE|nr:hypothetical protein [Burkholderia sola]